MNDKPTNFKIAVGALIFNEAQELLLTKKTYGSFRGLWSLPEGYAEDNELPARALLRELKEELEAEAEIGDLLAVRFRKADGENTAYFVFEAKVLNLDKIKADGYELSEIKFMKAAEALANEKVYSLVKFILSRREAGKTGNFKATDFLPKEVPAGPEDYILYM